MFDPIIVRWLVKPGKDNSNQIHPLYNMQSLEIKINTKYRLDIKHSAKVRFNRCKDRQEKIAAAVSMICKDWR